MRAVCAVFGSLFILVGLAAVITGEAAVHGAWVLALTLAVAGIAGLAAAATAASR